ncbi:phosphate ABC transporter ATP-binding protein [Ktedonobacter robiniae]|uniref:Phosphate import ATP-binding protein PstB 2 n=1 Tax=Ktedonobacter robiniae TaxID=2778365 RepID=A0ABQ3URG6_9CHLR|nr:ATP-binding cassette domain-containing protein [Ktedonobacter robiniae]GHO55341.1 phosphate import ATP-binding protein PstB 2 [Ktedonobacter robiniae]
MSRTTPQFEIRDLNVFYGRTQRVFHVSVDIERYGITAFLGSSGSGKSSLLRVLNHTYDLFSDVRIEGNVLLDGEDLSLYGRNSTEIMLLRQRVGMVCQCPNPFPRSIYENVAYGLRLRYGYRKRQLDERVEQTLQRVGLWHNVKERLTQHALHLAAGQQQLLCLARALALEPDVLMLDEPCSLLDPAATYQIETLLQTLGQEMTIILTTSNPYQARRMADTTGVLFDGQLVEYAPTYCLFLESQDVRTVMVLGTNLYGAERKSAAMTELFGKTQVPVLVAIGEERMQ